MSKGSKPRSLSISQKEFERRWNKAFSCKKSHKLNKETLKSMELTDKNVGLTEYNNLDEFRIELMRQGHE